MKQQEYLFALIESLTKSEKRHFKLFSSLQSGDKSYLDIFNQLELGKSIADKDLLPGSSANNVAVIKNYLNQQLMRSLRNYYHSTSSSIRIQTHLHDVEILFDKRLLPQARKSLRKAQKEAWKFERFGLLLEALEWERKINLVSDNPSRLESEIYAETNEVLEKLQNLLQYQSLFNQLMEIKQVFGYLRGSDTATLDKFINSGYLNDEKQALSVRARYYYYLILTNYYFQTGNYKKEYATSTKIVQMDRSALDGLEALNGTFDHISSCMSNLRYGEALFYLAALDKLKNKLPVGKFEQIRIKTFYFQTNYSLQIYMETGNLDLLKKKLKKAEEELQTYEGKITVSMEVVITATIVYSYFCMGNLKLAKRWNNKILNLGKKNVRADVYNSSRFMQLLILAELEQHESLAYELKSAKRYYQNMHQENGSCLLELTTIEYFKKLHGALSKQSVSNIASELKQAIEKVGVDKNELIWQDELETVKLWIESKISGEPIQTLKLQKTTDLEPFIPEKATIL